MTSDLSLSRRHVLRSGIAGLFATTMLVLPPFSPLALANGGSGDTQIQGKLSLPPATRTIHVSNQSQLDAALAAAIPGDHIVLANGNYRGPGNWTKNGTQANPIVVRSANLMGATFNGSFNPSGSDLILYGLDFVSATCNPGNARSSQRIKIWRNRFRDRASGTGIALRTYNVQGIDIAYCEWVNWAGRGVSAGIAAGTRNFTIRRCLFRDAPNQRSGNTQFNATESIQIGFGFADAAINANGLIEECRFQAWSSDDEVVAIKAQGVTVRRCTMENCWGTISNRMGHNNRFESNTIANSGGFWNWSGANYYLGNAQTGQHSSGFPSQNRLFAGNTAARSYPNNSTFNASDQVVFSGNNVSGGVLVGYAPSWSSGVPATNTRIRQHTGAVSLGTQSGTSNQPSSNESEYTWSARVYLTNADVGPYARSIDPADEFAQSNGNQSNNSSDTTSQQQSELQNTGGAGDENSQQQHAQGSSGSNNSDGCAINSPTQQPVHGQDSISGIGTSQCNPDAEAALRQYQGQNGWDVATKYRRKAHENFLEMSKYPSGSAQYNQYFNQYRICDAIHNRAREIASSHVIIK